MYVQTTPISNPSLPLPLFSTPYLRPTVMNQLQRFKLSSKSRSGFSNSSKMVSETPISSKNNVSLVSECFYGCLYPARDKFQSVELSSKLKSGFHNSAKRVFRAPISLRKYGGLVRVRCGGSEEVHDDGYYMRRSVELARKAVGRTSPNPVVGCVIVKDGKVVGEGFHPKAGEPHAEVFALRDAGDLAENATAYVTLEPCNHYGRTPPCSEALIKAKVKRVVVGMVDPNPMVASKGIQRLRVAGIEVTASVEEELCKKLNEPFIHKMLTGNPFVTLRYSISVNGCILNRLGEEVLEMGGYYSRLLQEYDAVVYSSSLLNEKCSFLASKEPDANQPLQVVLAKSPTSKILIPDSTSSKVIIFTEKETAVEPEIAENGIETVVSDTTMLSVILEHCKRQGLNSVLLDLRGDSADFDQILKEGFEQNLFQKVVAEVLPVWSGNQEETWKYLGQTLPVKNLIPKVSGNSILLEGYFC